MSFEFDPNKNPDRSEDGNDPQDIESFGGEGGLYGKVLGGPQVGATNRSQGQAHDSPGQDQGQPLGDQGLPLERQGQAKACGGLGQAQGGQVPRSARQAESLLACWDVYHPMCL
jgi:hypothetical protein